ncbi:MAG TPA: endolytic transglycosylase MltG [Patescibacteria group bacterium]|nr:endolytic transglycosylase MltG [Patescibacteria group bacterium]
MSRFSVIISVVLSALVLVSVYVAGLYYDDSSDPASRRVEIKVLPGATLKDVQTQLVENGVLKRSGLFRWAAYLTRKERRIQAGRYLFMRGESVAAVLDKLASGAVDYTRVVIPEGFMVTEIAAVLRMEAEIDSAAFMELAYDDSVLARFGIEAPSLEGYLFPDTYLFSWPLTPRDVIERMVHRFREVYDDSMQALADSVGFGENEAVTLASIIQAEAVYDSEMPRISAVYHNRLERGWRLEADPTVAYAIGGVRRRLYYKDLRAASPYNTYRVHRLPPGPICSPGRAAILAAVQPQAGSDYLYFVADGTGRHYFSKTLREHLIAKERVRDGSVPWVDEFEEPNAGGEEEVTSE